MVIYTGAETKLRLNNGTFVFKQSQMDKDFNKTVLIFILIIIVLLIIFSSLYYNSISSLGPKMKYIYPEDKINFTSYTLLSLGSFFLLYNQFVPLSIIVVMEVVKSFYALIIWNDAEMIGYDHYNQEVTRSTVKNLTLIDELGAVNYMFCDKTGTLTQNELVFKAFSTSNDVKYEYDSDTFESYC